MSRTVLQSYGTQQVMTSSPAKLIALLFDKAIVSLKEAVRAIEDGQVERRWKANSKAIDIITHLANTLDHDSGGEIAGNLGQLYEFMLARLLNVDLKNDAQAAIEVIELLQPLRDAWHQLAEDPGTQAAHQGAKSGSGRPAGGERPAGQDSGTASNGTKGSSDSPQRQPVNLSA